MKKKPNALLMTINLAELSNKLLSTKNDFKYSGRKNKTMETDIAKNTI